MVSHRIEVWLYRTLEVAFSTVVVWVEHVNPWHPQSSGHNPIGHCFGGCCESLSVLYIDTLCAKITNQQ